MSLTIKPRAMAAQRRRHGSEPALKRRLARILEGLAQSISRPRVELNYETPLQLLVATILSAQCTDERVNQVTPELFRRFPRALDYAHADRLELERLIRPTGFYASKARNLMACGTMLHEQFDGAVPKTMEALIRLPGVGRKTANVVLGACFGKPAIVVDTHVKRVARRLGLTIVDDPDRIEQDLQRLMPAAQWTGGSQRLLLHGRYVCVARRPKCEQCVVYAECAWEGKWPKPSKA